MLTRYTTTANGNNLRQSRRWSRRSFDARRKRVGMRPDLAGWLRRKEQTGCRREPEIKFDFEFDHRLCFFRPFTGFDDFAESARMLAVEGFFERLGHGARTDIVGKHADPRDRLQQKPMPANRAD